MAHLPGRGLLILEPSSRVRIRPTSNGKHRDPDTMIQKRLPTNDGQRQHSLRFFVFVRVFTAVGSRFLI